MIIIHDLFMSHDIESNLWSCRSRGFNRLLRGLSAVSAHVQAELDAAAGAINFANLGFAFC